MHSSAETLKRGNASRRPVLSNHFTRFNPHRRQTYRKLADLPDTHYTFYTMADSTDELNALFAPPPSTELPPDILGELQSMMRLHSIPPQELFYKWEYYSIKMGSDETKLDLNTARAFKKDIQEMLERETRGKVHVRSADKRSGISGTPRNAGSNEDVYGM